MEYQKTINLINKPTNQLSISQYKQSHKNRNNYARVQPPQLDTYIVVKRMITITEADEAARKVDGSNKQVIFKKLCIAY